MIWGDLGASKASQSWLGSKSVGLPLFFSDFGWSESWGGISELTFGFQIHRFFNFCNWFWVIWELGRDLRVGWLWGPNPVIFIWFWLILIDFWVIWEPGRDLRVDSGIQIHWYSLIFPCDLNWFLGDLGAGEASQSWLWGPNPLIFTYCSVKYRASSAPLWLLLDHIWSDFY